MLDKVAVHTEVNRRWQEVGAALAASDRGRFLSTIMHNRRDLYTRVLESAARSMNVVAPVLRGEVAPIAIAGTTMTVIFSPTVTEARPLAISYGLDVDGQWRIVSF